MAKRRVYEGETCSVYYGSQAYSMMICAPMRRICSNSERADHRRDKAVIKLFNCSSICYTDVRPSSFVLRPSSFVPNRVMTTCLRFLFCLSCIVALLGGATRTVAANTVLYDGARGTPPGAQQMILGMEPFQPGTPIETLFADSIELNTLDPPDRKAGYTGWPQVVPLLDRQAGFTVHFTVQLQAETHANPDRAGFSMIVLAADGMGIELSFWEAEIWAQATEPVLFTHGEGAPFDTTSRHTYDLTIQGDSYTLTAGAEFILSGPLRNYSAFGVPYNQANFIFLGDNTTSAGAQIRLHDVMIIAADLPAPTITPSCTAEAFRSYSGMQARHTASVNECFGPTPTSTATPTATPTPTPTPTPSATPSCTAEAFRSYSGVQARHTASIDECFGPTPTPSPSATSPAGAPTDLFSLYLPLNQR